MPKLVETAELIVQGRKYSDWESVSVSQVLNGSPPLSYRFTCSEALPLPKNWDAGTMQIRPGAACTVMLAGQLAVTGFVSTRQVFVDAIRHYIEIKGETYAHDAATAAASVPGMELKKAKPKKIIDELLKPTGIKWKVVGGALPEMTFPRWSISPGESIFENLVKLSLVIGARFTSDPDGTFVLHMGENGGSDSVVEGYNMLDGRELIQNSNYNNQQTTDGVRPPDDEVNGTKATHENHDEKTMPSLSGADRHVPAQVITNTPAWTKDHVKGRANLERNWQEEDGITVIVTVQGWLRPSGGLWKVGQTVHVKSPMLIMDMDLVARSVTFIQNNDMGSRTVLELMNQRVLQQIIPGGSVPISKD